MMGGIWEFKGSFCCGRTVSYFCEQQNKKLTIRGEAWENRQENSMAAIKSLKAMYIDRSH